MQCPQQFAGGRARDVFLQYLVCLILMLCLSSDSEESPVPIHKVELDLLLGHGLKLLHHEMIHMALGQGR